MLARVLAVALLASLSVPAQAAPLQPTGKWIVNFDDAKCFATRNYGSVEDPLLLVIKSPPLGNVLQIRIVRKGYVPGAAQLDGEILFDNRPPTRTSLLEFGVKRFNHRSVLVNLPDSERASFLRASSIRIRAGQEKQVLGSRIPVRSRMTNEHFALTQVPQLLKTMDTCVADLRRVWNIVADSAAPPFLVAEARGDLTGMFRPDDYPGVAIDKEQSGSVGLVIMVDEQGRVADCTVIESSGIAALDAQSCAVVTERARLKAAIGRDGKPAKSAFHQRISWRIGA